MHGEPLSESSIEFSVRPSGSKIFMSRVLSVFWHGVAPESLPPELETKDPRPSVFRAQVEFFARNYCPISVWDFLDIIETRRSVGSYARPPVLLGFDDGFRSVILNALPILVELGVPAVFFVVGDVIDKPDFIPWFVERRYMIRRARREHVVYRGVSLDLARRQARENAHHLTEVAFRGAQSEWERQAVLTEFAEVVGVPRPTVEDLDDDLQFVTREDLLRLGPSSILTVASHAATHRHLGDLDPDEQLHELTRSDTILQKLSPSYCQVIAYPAGCFNETTVSIAKKIYRAGFAVFQGASYRNSYAYPRVGLGDETVKELPYAVSALRMSFFMPLKKWLRIALPRARSHA